MLTINCPDGQLVYPKSLLENNPYIQHSLIDKHFFGSFGQLDNIFLQFGIKSVRLLIPFFRSGNLNDEKIDKEGYEMFRYLSMESPDNLFYAIATDYENHVSSEQPDAIMDIYGRKITDKTDPAYNHEHIVPYNEEVAKNYKAWILKMLENYISNAVRDFVFVNVDKLQFDIMVSVQNVDKGWGYNINYKWSSDSQTLNRILVDMVMHHKTL